MALIICPECGKEFSSRAAACPNCGCPNETENIGLSSSETTAEQTETEETANETPTTQTTNLSDETAPVQIPDVHSEDAPHEAIPSAQMDNETTYSSYENGSETVQGAPWGQTPFFNNPAQQPTTAPAYNTFQNPGSAQVPKKGGIKKTAILISAIAALTIIIGLVIALVLTNNKQTKLSSESEAQSLEDNNKAAYEEANALYLSGSYEEAYTAFKAIGDYKDASSRASYCKALALCEKGNYSGAYELLKDIPNYEKTKTLLMQIYYETRFFEGLKELRSAMKNPDSLTINSIEVYYSDDKEKERPKSSPNFFIKESGQNGFGGYSSGYTYFYEEDGTYTWIGGTCDSLDEDSYDLSDHDEALEYMLCIIITGMRRNDISLNDVVDFERITKIVTANNYTGIKRVPELKFESFSDLLLSGDEL